METRYPVAENFYAGDTASLIEDFIAGFTAEPPAEPVKAAVVPHAGWFYSGATAAKTFKTIRESRSVDTFILLGAVHDWRVTANSIDPEGVWRAGGKDFTVDADLAAGLIENLGDMLEVSPRAHSTEHAIEVQLPMIGYFFPEAEIVPIAVVPSEQSHEIGNKIAHVISGTGKDCVVVASTDLTHYGANYGFAPAGTGKEALEYTRKNDRSIIDLALAMKADRITGEARRNRNSCGSGAFAAAVGAAAELGVQKGRLVEYVTSYDKMPGKDFSLIVGYCGIVF